MLHCFQVMKSFIEVIKEVFPRAAITAFAYLVLSHSFNQENWT